MADITQAIRNFLLIAVPGVHIGEDIPQSISGSYVWFGRQGDIFGDELCHPLEVEAVLFDFECVATNIDTCRTLTEHVKSDLMNTTLHQLSFFSTPKSQNQTIHAFDVEDHDDSYVPHIVETDQKLYIGSFRVTAHMGVFFTPPPPL